MFLWEGALLGCLTNWKHCKAYYFGGKRMNCAKKRWTDLNDIYTAWRFCARSCLLGVAMIATAWKLLVAFTLIFWATVCKTVRPMLSDRYPVRLSVSVCLHVGVLWSNGWMDEDETWHAGRPRTWPHYVRWEPSSPPLNFWPISVVAKWLDGLRCHLVWGRPWARRLC